MANVLEMAIVQAILQLHAAKWSQRRIARELNIDRGAVARCLKSLPADPKPAIPPTGSEGSKPATFERAPAPAVEGSDRSEDSGRSGVPKPAIPLAGKSGSPDAALPACNRSSPSATAAGRHSDCEPLREIIQAKLDQGLSAQRIYQDHQASPRRIQKQPFRPPAQRRKSSTKKLRGDEPELADRDAFNED